MGRLQGEGGRERLPHAEEESRSGPGTWRPADAISYFEAEVGFRLRSARFIKFTIASPYEQTAF